MRLLLFLAILAITAWAQDLSPSNGANVVTSQYISMEMHNRAAGMLAWRAVVKFVSGIDLVANTHSIVVQQTGVVGTICGGWTTPGWTLFVPRVNLIFANDTAVNPAIFGQNTGEDLEDIRFSPLFDFNLLSTVPISALGAIVPRGRGIVSEDGETLVVTLETANGRIVGVNTRTTGDNRLKAGVQYEMFIPQRFLSPNLEYPEQTVSTTLGFILTSQLTIPIPFKLSLLDFLVAPIEVITPFTVTTPELATSAILVMSAVPSSTIQGQQLSSLVITFILGVPIFAGGYLGVEADQDIWADVAIANTVITVAVGYNCAAVPELCCSQSVVTTRPQGNGGVNPLVLPSPGWSQMRIRLGPKGCMLPKDKVTVLTLTTPLLSRNPAIADPWNPLTRPFQAGVAIPVNIRLYSSSEPAPANVARYGEPRHPLSNGIYITPYSAGFHADFAGVPFRFLQFDIVSWTSYVVGYSTVRDFSATPATTTTNVVPDYVVFKWTLSTVAINNRSAATVNGVIITANQGVFKPNQGRLDAPNPVVAGTLPGACANARWYTNAYSSLIIMLNPLFNVQAIPDSAAACAAALATNTVITLTIPADAFLPNIATGQWVYFDIRMVDPFMDNHLQLFTFGPTGGWTTPHAGSVDTATLMQQNGWFTTAGCTANTIFGYTPSAVTDIRSLSVEARCELVCGMGLLSPVSGGILQCPTAAQAINSNYFVTYVKVPEAAFNGVNWPWSYTFNSPYPTAVSFPNNAQVYITNFGYIIESPMFAVVVIYPPVSNSIQSLGLIPSVPTTWTVLLVIRLDRLTESCQVLLYDPWEFIVVTNKQIVQCLYFPSDGSNLAGVPLDAVTWGARHFYVPGDGAVVCWTAIVASPTPEDDGSDDALFGLLALIAIPILLCYCLLALLWFLRPKRETPCCAPEAPVQEMYWVTAQQPVYVVEQQVAAPTPVYVLQ